jgi:hypothetical protein
MIRSVLDYTSLEGLQSHFQRETGRGWGSVYENRARGVIDACGVIQEDQEASSNRLKNLKFVNRPQLRDRVMNDSQRHYDGGVDIVIRWLELHR